LNELESSEVFEAAARATINERCGSAFLHDVRGSMQALFSAFELLGRSARMGGGDTVRVEKACDLAKRAITNHEKATLQILELLTLQHDESMRLDLGIMVREAAHFLRNDAANKSITLKLEVVPDLEIFAPRARLQTLLAGLFTAAIDQLRVASVLQINAKRDGAFALLSVGADSSGERSGDPVAGRELTLQFARQFMQTNGGRLEIDPAADGRIVRLYFPVGDVRASLAAAEVSASEK
jgi:hypothetical protein